MDRRTSANVRPPQFNLLGKSGLKSICWETDVDVSFAAAPVTGVDSNFFMK